MQLLEIQTSARLERSVSRQLSGRFVSRWRELHPAAHHVQRDLGVNPPPFVNEAFTVANYTPPAQRTAEMQEVLAPSEGLIAELVAADRIVLGVPIYNFNVPAVLKAYFDQITRVGLTVAFDRQAGEFRGLLRDKKLLAVVPSADNYAPGSKQAGEEFCVPFLRKIWSFLGVSEITIVTVPDQAGAGPARSSATLAAEQTLDECVVAW